MQQSPICYGEQARLRQFLAGLKECGSSMDVARGRQIHREAVHSGDDKNLYLASSLIAMYSKCGDVSSAREVFGSLRCRDVAVWTALIIGYADNGLEEQALGVFRRMDCSPTPRAFVAALKACSKLAERDNDHRDEQETREIGDVGNLGRAREIHARASKLGFDASDVFVGNTLVDMYAKFGCMFDARRAFEKIAAPDRVSWNALVLGYATNLQEKAAFSRFLSVETRPDHLSFVAVLKACSGMAMKEAASSSLDSHGRLVKVASLETGMAIHREAARRGLDTSLFVASSLVDMYAKCGSVADSRRVYDGIEGSNVVIWTALMLGYVENGEEALALKIFAEMRPINCQPNARSFLAATRACSGIAAKEQVQEQSPSKIKIKIKSLEKGMAVHSEAIRCRCCDLHLSSSLVTMYGKCGSMVDARRAFDGSNRRNKVLCTALLSGYADNGEAHRALELLTEMRREGYRPNSAAFVAGLGACEDGAAAAAGIALHAEICRDGFESDAQVGSKLVDLYSKLGMMDKAQQVFDSVGERNTVSWTSLLAGYSRAGKSAEVFCSFYGMLDEGFCADSVTLLCLITACSHGGFVERGLKLVECMSSRFGVNPAAEHYACVADLLGRAQLKENIS